MSTSDKSNGSSRPAQRAEWRRIKPLQDCVWSKSSPKETEIHFKTATSQSPALYGILTSDRSGAAYTDHFNINGRAKSIQGETEAEVICGIETGTNGQLMVTMINPVEDETGHIATVIKELASDTTYELTGKDGRYQLHFKLTQVDTAIRLLMEGPAHGLQVTPVRTQVSEEVIKHCEAHFKIFMTGISPGTTADMIMQAIKRLVEDNTLTAEVLSAYRTTRVEQGYGGLLATDEAGHRELLALGTIMIGGEEVQLSHGSNKRTPLKTMQGTIEMRLDMPANRTPEMLNALDKTICGLLGGTGGPDCTIGKPIDIPEEYLAQNPSATVTRGYIASDYRSSYTGKRWACINIFVSPE